MVVREDAVRTRDIFCLHHSDPHHQLFAGSIDGAVRCWSTRGLTSMSELPEREHAYWMAHSGRVSSLLQLGDGALLSSSYDGSVRCWRRRGPDWSLEADARGGEGAGWSEGARVLGMVACGGADTVLCGTSEGTVHVLERQGLGLVDSLTIEPSKGREPDRMSAVATIDVVEGAGVGDDQTERSIAVVGSSSGELHLIST